VKGRGFISAGAAYFPQAPHWSPPDETGKSHQQHIYDRLNPVALTPSITSYLYDKYELLPDELEAAGVLWSPSAGHEVFPMRDGFGYFRGYTTKRVAGFPPTNPSCGHWPKSIRVSFTQDLLPDRSPAEHSFLVPAFCHVARTPHAIIVEDMLSAIKLSRYAPNGVWPILGSTPSDDNILFLRRHMEVSKVMLMLDPDQWQVLTNGIPKPLYYTTKFGPLFEDFVPVSLDQDPKDTPHEELKDIFQEYMLCYS